MHPDFLLIGQGICGTWLSHYLEKAGYSFLIIDDLRENSPSRVAAGIINPVTGRRIVKTWMIDEVLPFAQKVYTELGDELGVTALHQKNIVDFFPTPQMKLAFEKRFSEDTTYLEKPTDEYHWLEYFNYDFGYGIIQPCFLVDLPAILPAYRKRLLAKGALINETFDLEKLEILDGKIKYDSITANHIIFCDGYSSFNHPLFRNLPFAPNKGEALWIEAPELPSNNIFKKGMNLVPWSDGIFWVGSTYEWTFEHENTTPEFRERTIAQLKHWLKRDFRVVDHKASVRPATLERRPFVGFHPLQPTVGLFNGMGTKGCSLAPFFAKQWVDKIATGSALEPEADLARFNRILSR